MSDFEKQVLRELRAIRNVLEKMSGERSEIAKDVTDPFRNVVDKGDYISNITLIAKED